MGEIKTFMSYIFATGTLVISYFLSKTMGDLKTAMDLGTTNKSKTDLLELEIKHTNSKVDEIYSMLKEISTDIKTINKAISKME